MIGSNETEETFGFFDGPVTRCLEFHKGALPIRVMRSAYTPEAFEHHFSPTVVFALHACQPCGKPLRGKGVAGGLHFRFA